MTKTNGRAEPKKSAPQARPLLAGEVLTLCGDNRALAMELYKHYKRGKKDFATAIMRMVFKIAGDTVSAEYQRKFFKAIDENVATRILRKMSKEIAAGRVKPLQLHISDIRGV